MRQIAKWTMLCVCCAVLGFGATVGVANHDRLLRTLTALLPTPQTMPAAPVTLDDPAAALAPVVEAEPEAVALATEVDANQLSATVGTLAAGGAPSAAEELQTVAPPGELVAVGTVQLARDRQVVMEAGGRVDTVNVEVGDVVQQGDVLFALDTTYLAWDVEQAEISLETARIDFEEAGKLVDDADIAVAEANLLSAQEDLALVEAGPTAEDLAAAEASAAAAWARYADLQAGPTDTQLVQFQAQLKYAEIDVQAAQREYDKIAWLPESAASAAADALQHATIAYEAAQASFDEATKPATEADLQAALSSAQSAQSTLNELKKKPTPAELAAAQARVASAQAALDEVNKGPEQAAVRKAEYAVRQAMIGLNEAQLALDAAQVKAPVNGTVLDVNVDLGQQVAAGTVVAVLADTADVRLTVNVEQRDIRRIQVGQEVNISIYALPDEMFTGVVEQIAPAADSQTGFVTFPVMIRFAGGPLEQVLPGMTASANFVEAAAAIPDAASDTAPAATEAAPAVEITPTITSTLSTGN